MSGAGLCASYGIRLPQPCRREGYQDPKNCWRCRCPDGFGGHYCESVQVSVNGLRHAFLSLYPHLYVFFLFSFLSSFYLLIAGASLLSSLLNKNSLLKKSVADKFKRFSVFIYYSVFVLNYFDNSFWVSTAFKELEVKNYY